MFLQCVFVNGKPTYVTIKIDNKKVAKTSHEHDRVWNQTFQILCAHPADATITITLKTKCSVLGKIQIQALQILNEASLISGFFPLEMENGKPNPDLRLRFMLWFKPAAYEPTWGKIISNGEFQGLRNASFPQRSNCHVKLYHDAHHSSSFEPPYDLCGSPGKLWEDVYKAIEGAKHLIYIAGWSLNPKMVLVNKIKHFLFYYFLFIYSFDSLFLILEAPRLICGRSEILKQKLPMQEEFSLVNC